MSVFLLHTISTADQSIFLLVHFFLLSLYNKKSPVIICILINHTVKVKLGVLQASHLFSPVPLCKYPSNMSETAGKYSLGICMHVQSGLVC